MLQLASVRTTIDALMWLCTLGKSDVQGVKRDILELIQDLSKSLTNLWDLTNEITSIQPDKLDKAQLDGIFDYFYRYYLGRENISSARTHCHNITRDVGRITFRLAKILQTDLGKWKDVDQSIDQIINTDADIFQEYDECINGLHERLKRIGDDLKECRTQKAQKAYKQLQHDLKSDIEGLRKGMDAMEKALGHIQTFAG